MQTEAEAGHAACADPGFAAEEFSVKLRKEESDKVHAARSDFANGGLRSINLHGHALHSVNPKQVSPVFTSKEVLILAFNLSFRASSSLMSL